MSKYSEFVKFRLFHHPQMEDPGWELIEIVEEDIVYTVRLEKFEGGVNCSTEEAYPIKAPRFLFGLRGDRIKELSNALEQSNSGKVEAEKALKEAEKSLESMSEGIKARDTRAESQGKTLAILRQEKADLNSKLRKMEYHLACVRRAIGEEKMKSIIEEAGPSAGDLVISGSGTGLPPGSFEVVTDLPGNRSSKPK